jgi:hypothetical protein
MQRSGMVLENGHVACFTFVVVDVPKGQERGSDMKTVELPLPAKSLAYWDTTRQDMVVEPDAVEVSVGGSSADEKLKTTAKVQQATVRLKATRGTFRINRTPKSGRY